MNTTNPGKNKRALVTGAGRGIGAAIALELARHGNDVVLNYRQSKEAAEKIATEIKHLGRQAMLIQANIAEKSDIERMFNHIEDTWGQVDILVNNAGIEERWPTRECKETNYDNIMNTNVKGAFFCAQRALEGMKQNNWGRVINISSVHEIKPTGFCSVYGISKGALFMMMRELALEYSPFGITVNNVAPGAIYTDINREVLANPDYEAKVITKIPAGFIGQAEDVAKVVAFLASDDARYITGASIFVDGGLSL